MAGVVRRQSRAKVLVIDDSEIDTATWRASAALCLALRERGVEVLTSRHHQDAVAIVRSDAALDLVVIDWDLGHDHAAGAPAIPQSPPALEIVTQARRLTRDLPLFLAANRSDLTDVPVDVLAEVDDYIWLLDDTTDFIAGRIMEAVSRYRAGLYPPMFKALVEFAEQSPYSWHTPGHTGGTAFLRTAAGRTFFDFYGEALFRTDLSISVESLGSLLDHTGPIGEAERYASRVFGSDFTYFVTNGSSTSNRVVFTGCVTEGEVVLVDRNCHKSIEHSCVMTGAIPTYLIPSRNRYGIIGPIYPEQLTAEAIAAGIEANPLAPPGARPVHAILTNSTYDGLTYDVPAVATSLGECVDRIHFDEAWFGYARFNPMYAGRHAMHRGPSDPDGPTLFATQSTHKLLPALSQASMLHVRQGRAPVNEHHFNESFMMHASTSPAYPIIASADVATAMMDGPSGKRLTGDCIAEAVSFRKTIARIRRDEMALGSWFFDVWQPPQVTAIDGTRVAFEDASDALLTSDPAVWALRSGESWHGFDGLADGFAMLDPIKVTLLTPGVQDDWTLAEKGIPAYVVARMLQRQGIVVEKTGDYTLLFLFSMGITKGKWGTLVSALFDVKRAIDTNAPLIDVLPDLVALSPERYSHIGLADLASQMHDHLREFSDPRLLADAFGTLPDVAMTPRKAYTHLVRGEVDLVALEDLPGRIVATSVVPYPPGIPVLMAGEIAGPTDGALLRYLHNMQESDRAFPGFESDNHGVEVVEGKYYVSCVASAAIG